MSKTEDKALEAYPIVMSQYSDNCKEYDSNESDRLAFIEGYHQAEKDFELTRKEIYEWLANHYRDYMYNPTGKKLEAFFGGDIINDLKQAMKDEKI